MNFEQKKQQAITKAHQQWLDQQAWVQKLKETINATDGKYLHGFPADTQQFIKKEAEKGYFTLKDDGHGIIVRVAPVEEDKR